MSQMRFFFVDKRDDRLEKLGYKLTIWSRGRFFGKSWNVCTKILQKEEGRRMTA